MKIKKDTWLDTIIEAFEYLDGDAKYKELYPVVKELRISKGLSWTNKSEQSIQATIEENSTDSISYCHNLLHYGDTSIESLRSYMTNVKCNLTYRTRCN